MLNTESDILKLSTPIKPGRAEVFFEIVSSNTMSRIRKEAGLRVIVRYGTVEYGNTFVSCRAPDIESVSGGEIIIRFSIPDNIEVVLSER